MGFKILGRDDITTESVRMVVAAPFVARKCEPGQFVILRLDERGERIPLTIADFDRGAGTVTIIFQKVGKTTYHLATFREGEEIRDFVGPLGRHLDLGKIGTVACLGGGLGIAPIYPKVRALKAGGNYVVSIIGARRKDFVILEDEMRAQSDELFVTTDDGSYGLHGFVTDQLKLLLEEGRKFDTCLAVGPIPMMEAVCKLTAAHDLPTLVSLDTIMVDGTGMCGSCRVTVGDETKFTCVDGPVFDGHQVDWLEAKARQRRYHPQEREAMEKFETERGTA
ncbi:MAG: sulfide/dihydroorotate dehydrogenase-like FAD/NAD-binding protein [candidate division Zixibacteria bacterium]|nr:sulfide/dihydroorotate dehydrogenase-like FAD/NAD-binding protein [candidate division Zixibacteria bacterium]